jgi:alpha-tubulin suppressor-like RCC1 family protein
VKKRFLAMVCGVVLCVQLAIPAIGVLAEMENMATERTNPFALMYDSDERLAKSLEEQWDTLMEDRRKVIQMEGNQDTQLGETSAGEFSSFAKEPDQPSPSKSQDKDILQQSIISLARLGNLKDVQDLGLPEEATEQIERMVEDSGESRFIVKYKHSARRDQGKETLRSHSAEKQMLEEGLELLTLPEKVNPAIFAEELRAAGMESEIEYIQPDFALSIDSLRLTAVEEQPGDEAVVIPPVPVEEEVPPPDEEETPADETPPEEQPEESWDEPEDLNDKSGEVAQEEEVSHSPVPITVALIDTGVDQSHPALAGYLGEGWNFVANTAEIYNPEQPMRSAHGTHVAGIIAQAAEEYGADVTILPLMVFDGGLAYTSNIIAAITYAGEIGADIVNCSFGSTSENPALYDVIESSDALFIAAVGNSRRDLNVMPSYPACYDLPNMISVASVNADGGFSYFSNYSDELVDMTALGRDIYSALPNGEIGPMTGTSMSAAQVSGGAAVAASLLEYEGEGILTAEELRELLMNSADKLDNLSNKSVDGHRINIGNLLAGKAGVQLALSPEDDFDVHGVQRTEEENWLLFGSLKVVQVEAGAYYNLVLMSDGTVWMWGTQMYEYDYSIPIEVLGLRNIVGIASGNYHSLALKADGTVWSWGYNWSGQLGDGSTTMRLAPVQVQGLTGVVGLAAGYSHSLAVKTDGTVWAWGANESGQLGDNRITKSYTPVQIQGLNGVTGLASGYSHSLALKTDGTVWAWGANGCGQLGDGSQTNRNGPVQVQGLTGITEIAAGYNHSLVLKLDGSVWAFGDSQWGQLGDGTQTSRNRPVQVQGLLGATEIAAGDSHSLALKADGTVWSWGNNNKSQLGSYYEQYQVNAVQMQGIGEVSRISAGELHSLALKKDGSVWVWGDNSEKQLGTGFMKGCRVPIQTQELKGAVKVASGPDHGLMLTEEGTVWAWGNNESGELGDGTTFNRGWPTQVSRLTGITGLSAGASHSLALKADGTVWAWGANGNGQLGDGSQENHSTPVQTQGLTGVIGIAAGDSHSLALRADGTVWAWGGNWSGQLGTTGISISTIPVQVSGLTDVVKISARNSYSLALKSDGTVWIWGNSYFDSNNFMLKQIQGLDGVIEIAAGGEFMLALKSNGTVWQRDQYSSEQVQGLTDMVGIAAGSVHALAWKGNGMAWGWGSDNCGQLGVGSDIPKRSEIYFNEPVQVLNLAEVISMAGGEDYSVMVNADGTVWTSGASYYDYNNYDDAYGQLCQGKIFQSSTPIQIKQEAFPSPVPAAIRFTDTQYIIEVPDTGTANQIVKAKVYDPGGYEIDEDVTYALAKEYPCVSIESSTGKVTVSESTQPGQAEILATCGSLQCTAALVIIKASNGTTLSLNVSQGTEYLIALSADSIADLEAKEFALAYDPAILQPADLCAFTWGKELKPGAIAGTGITIIRVESGAVIFTVDRSIPSGKTWSGTLNILRFKAIKNGWTELSISLIAS